MDRIAHHPQVLRATHFQKVRRSRARRPSNWMVSSVSDRSRTLRRAVHGATEF